MSNLTRRPYFDRLSLSLPKAARRLSIMALLILAQPAHAERVRDLPTFGTEIEGVKITGALTEALLIVGTERELVTPERTTDFGPFSRGDCMSVRTTGGGGWGDPRQRDPERIREDILNELITREDAVRDYGYQGE